MSTLQSINPASGEVLGELPVTTEEEIKSIIKNAHQVKSSWSATDIQERKRLVVQAYGEMSERRQEFIELIHREMGKTLAEAEGEVIGTLDNIAALCDEIIEALTPRIIDDGSTRTVLHYDPLGVCVSIAPWNFPLMMPHEMVVPSLIAGNVVILKPSEETTLVAKLYFDILNKYLPTGVLQFVVGAGEQGSQLVASDIQLVAFTGSRDTGSRILQSAGKGLKRVLLELGGKDPLIVLEDADIAKAARFAAANSFRNCGQVCVSTERIYVMDEVADDFMDELRKASEHIQVGPMIHDRQKQHVKKQIAEAVEQGAELVYGDPEQGEGNFIEPLIMTNLNHGMSIMRDETFGPVACVMKVQNYDEAVELANDTEYGLGAVVFGGDTEETQRVARGLSAGMVGINKSCGGASSTPWVGANQSGYGYHSSQDGHRQFAQVRLLSEAKS